MYRIIVVIFLLFFIETAHSQILNIERTRLQPDSMKVLETKFTAGFNVFNRSAAEDSPVNLTGFNLNLNSIYQPDRHAIMLMSQFDYLKINEDVFLNFGFVHGRANFLREEKLNYEIYSQYSYDNFRGLDSRVIGGGGIRYRLLEGEKTQLILGVGGFYERESWQVPNTEEFVNLSLFKNSNYLSFRTTINSVVDLNMIVYYQTGYDNSIQMFRNRYSNFTVINTNITKRLSLMNSFEISYEDKPVVPITKLVFAFNTGLSLNF